MNKQQVAVKLSDVTGITNKEATSIVGALVTIIGEELVAGGEIAISGFGTLKTVDRKERISINPQTKEKMTIPAKKAVKFVASKILKDEINK